jgi:HEAT repeat protein
MQQGTILVLLMVLAIAAFSGCLGGSDQSTEKKVEQQSNFKLENQSSSATAQNTVTPLMQDAETSNSQQNAKAKDSAKGGEGPVASLVQALKDTNPEVRNSTIASLAKIGEPAVEPLIGSLKDTDSNVRIGAIEVLGDLKFASAIDPLIETLNDQNFMVREGALDALVKIGGPAVGPLIQSLGKGGLIRESATDALVKIREPALNPLIEALRDGNLEIRNSAATILGDIGDSRATEPLVKSLNEESWGIQSEATIALAKIHEGDATTLIPYLNNPSTIKVYLPLVKIGDSKTVNKLVKALHEYGNYEMAVDYLNCGNKRLEDAGNEWGQDHGFVVTSNTGNGPRIVWGGK